MLIFGGVLNFIADGIAAIAAMVLWAVVTAINLLVEALGALIAALMSILPAMPAQPSVGGQWVGWLNWFLPVGEVLALAGLFITAYVGLLGLMVVLRWVKAL